MITKKDKIAAVADEIISLDKNVGSTLIEVLKRIAASDRSHVYVGCKKYLRDDYGHLIADSGHVGISDRYIPNVMYPGTSLSTQLSTCSKRATTFRYYS